MKYEKGKCELAMSVHVDGVFMAGNTETLKVIKEKIRENFNISDSVKVNTFLRVYYKRVHNVKGTKKKCPQKRT